MAVREFPVASGHGFADYALFVGGKAAGAVEAKKVGVSLTGVEVRGENCPRQMVGALMRGRP